MNLAGQLLDQYTLTSGREPADITAGPDGRIWFTEGAGNRIGAINPFAADIQASIFEYPLPSGGSDPSGITAAPPFVWFTEFGGNRIGRISTTGDIAEFPAGSGEPSGIAAGSDGALWFTETVANKIGRMTLTGALTNEFGLATPGSQPGDITAGPDGALWFTEIVGNKIGRIAVAPPFVPPPPPPPATPAKPSTKKKKCKVPRLRGNTIKQARRKLRRAKCKYKIRGKGRVVSTSPKAGRTTTKRVTVKCKRKKAKRTGRRATAGAIQ
jgi:streptogramin lyase